MSVLRAWCEKEPCIVRAQLMRPCVCVFICSSNICLFNTCVRMLSFFCAILMQAFHSSQPYTDACDIWLFTTHSRFLFHLFFRLLFMLHDCSEWRRYSLHLSCRCAWIFTAFPPYQRLAVRYFYYKNEYNILTEI